MCRGVDACKSNIYTPYDSEIKTTQDFLCDRFTVNAKLCCLNRKVVNQCPLLFGFLCPVLPEAFCLHEFTNVRAIQNTFIEVTNDNCGVGNQSTKLPGLHWRNLDTMVDDKWKSWRCWIWNAGTTNTPNQSWIPAESGSLNCPQCALCLEQTPQCSRPWSWDS